MENTNPKALNLDAVRMSESSVTLGFKCPPELKLTLAEKAENEGLTLSNYVCKLVDFKMKEKLLLRKKYEISKIAFNVIMEKNKTLTEAFNKVDDELKFFKNEILFDVLKKHKGKIVSYFNQYGKKVNIEINSIMDVYLLIIKSFKYEK
jgi:hypothetical protein